MAKHGQGKLKSSYEVLYRKYSSAGHCIMTTEI
jgi:hypothetical protein